MRSAESTYTPGRIDRLDASPVWVWVQRQQNASPLKAWVTVLDRSGFPFGFGGLQHDVTKRELADIVSSSTACYRSSMPKTTSGECGHESCA